MAEKVASSSALAAALSPTACSSKVANNVARIQRNVAEKQRRDKLNGYISELANIVPMISSSTKRLDKTSILRLSAAYLRICKSPLGGKKIKTLKWCTTFLNNEQVREIFESVDGFLIVTTPTGKILFASRSVERYLGHQDIDLIGHSLYSFIHEKDADDVKQKLKDMLSDCLNNGSSRYSFVCLMREKPQPRSEGITYKHVHFSGDMTNAEDISNEKASKSVVTHMFKAFVKIVNISPYNQLSLEEATADEYVTRHSLGGIIMFADHRLATITGHLPQEVIGLSAYEYIHKDDQPITLFAHRLMFSNAKGSGIIVYRLRTRDDKYVYLKSVGHLHYDSSTSKVDHLVCNNQQLDNSEGGIQLKYFFDQLNPHVIGNSLEDLQQSVKSLDISESLNHKVNGAMQLNGESPNHSTESDSSNTDSDELKNPKDDYRNDISDNCSSSDQEVFQENGSSYPGSPDHAANNGSISPCSSDTTEYKCDIKDQIYSICMTNTEYFITDINGSSSSSEPANDIYASDDNSVLSVNQSHNVHTPNKIMSLSKNSKNSHNLIEGPNHYMHNFQDTAFESLDSSSDTSDYGYSSCNGLDRNASMQINAQSQQVRTMGVNDQNVNKDLAPLEKIYEEETIFDTDMFSSHQNGTCSAESSPLLEVKTNSHYKINDEILECAEEPFVKHSSFINHFDCSNGIHSTLSTVNSGDSVLRNSKYPNNNCFKFHSTFEDTSSSMDYCDSRPIADDSMNGGTKGNLCLEENMSSLLSTALPYSDSNSHSANGWSDVFSPNEYPSPFSSEVLLEKDDQFLLNNPKLKSYYLC